MKNRRIYDNDFIQDALRLVNKGNKSPGALAKSLNVPSTTLRQWIIKNEKNPDHFATSRARRPELEFEVLDLKRRLSDAELERDILKKAVAIFSKTQK